MVVDKLTSDHRFHVQPKACARTNDGARRGLPSCIAELHAVQIDMSVASAHQDRAQHKISRVVRATDTVNKQ